MARKNVTGKRARAPKVGTTVKAQAFGSAFERNLSYRLAMLHFLLAKRIAAFYGAETLTTHQWKVLSVIQKFAPIPASEVQDWVSLDKAAISRAVGRLMERNLIARRVSAADGRTIDLVMTRTGNAINGRIARNISALQASLLAQIPKREVERMFSIFNNLESMLQPNRLNPASHRFRE